MVLSYYNNCAACLMYRGIYRQLKENIYQRGLSVKTFKFNTTLAGHHSLKNNYGF